MNTKVLISIFTVCVVCMCLVEQSYSKPLIAEDMENIQDENLIDTDRFLTKREIQPQGMALWEYCYRIRSRDPRCIPIRSNLPTVRIIKV